MEKLKLLFQLYKTFFFLGSVTFGGGYAMLPLLTREIAKKKKWATEEELLEYYAIGQSTPGIIAVNTATFIGYKIANIKGAIMASLGLISPSIIIISLLFPILSHLEDKIHYTSIILKVVVTALILNTIYELFLPMRKDIKKLIILAVSIVAVIVFKINLALLVLLFSLVAVGERLCLD